MHTEIERKFLVRGDYRKDAFKAIPMQQGYICNGSGRTVRVRICGDTAFLTIKGPSHDGGLSRYEWEKEIPVQEARELMELCDSGRIYKTRHLVKVGAHTFEVDEFHGDNEGLVVAEVELSAPDEAFEHPDWLGEEVTGDRRYYNASLCRNPFKNW